MTRRDKCYKVGEKSYQLTGEQAQLAWWELSHLLMEMGEAEMPKFNDLLEAVQRARVRAQILRVAKPPAPHPQ